MLDLKNLAYFLFLTGSQQNNIVKLMKKCNKCNKITNRFQPQRNVCIDCRNHQRRIRLRNRNNLVSVNIKLCHCCKILKASEDFHKSKRESDGLSRHCKVCRIVELKIRYEKNKEQIKDKNIQYYYDNKNLILSKQLERQKERIKTDRMYLLTRRLRNRLYYALKNKNWKKHTKFSEYIGCDENALIFHIETQFTEGMSWENQGKWHIDHIIPLNSAQTEEDLYKLCHYTNLQPLWAVDNIRKADN